MPTFSVSIPVELWDWLEGSRGEMPRSRVVKMALESWRASEPPLATITLPSVEVDETAVRALAKLEAHKERQDSAVVTRPVGQPASIPPGVVSASAVLRPAYGCPVAGCDFRAPSSKAVCGRHGRTVKEVAG